MRVIRNGPFFITLSLRIPVFFKICLSSDSSDQNIGKQSTATCGEDDGGKYLEYSNPMYVEYVLTFVK